MGSYDAPTTLRESPERTAEREGLLYWLTTVRIVGQVTLVGPGEHVGNDFGVRVRAELNAFAVERGLEGHEVLDDAVVDDGDGAVVGRADGGPPGTVGRPASVADCAVAAGSGLSISSSSKLASLPAISCRRGRCRGPAQRLQFRRSRIPDIPGGVIRPKQFRAASHLPAHYRRTRRFHSVVQPVDSSIETAD